MASATPTSIKMAKVPATLKPMLQAKKLSKRPHKLELGEDLGASGVFLVSVMLRQKNVWVQDSSSEVAMERKRSSPKAMRRVHLRHQSIGPSRRIQPQSWSSNRCASSTRSSSLTREALLIRSGALKLGSLRLHEGPEDPGVERSSWGWCWRLRSGSQLKYSKMGHQSAFFCTLFTF